MSEVFRCINCQLITNRQSVLYYNHRSNGKLCLVNNPEIEFFNQAHNKWERLFID